MGTAVDPRTLLSAAGGGRVVVGGGDDQCAQEVTYGTLLGSWVCGCVYMYFQQKMAIRETFLLKMNGIWCMLSIA